MKKNSRRDFIRKSVLTAGAVGLMSLDFKVPAFAESSVVPSSLPLENYPFELPPLGYAFNAMEPFIDAKTMEIHHDKHHKAYIDKLNAALEKYPEHQSKDLHTLLAQMNTFPDDLKTAIHNHGGGHYNHTMFWKMLTSEKNTQPSESLMKAITAAYPSTDKFKETVNATALSVFGSGWVWVIKDESKALKIVTSANQENPLMPDAKVKGQPILCIDVWEHAYYLNYQNKRADYLTAIWNVIDWKMMSDYFG